MRREERQRVAQETDAIVAAGGYRSPGPVDLSGLVEKARAGTHLHLPDDPLPEAGSLIDEGRDGGEGAAAVEVTPETSLAAVGRLHRETAADGAGSPACLNFASAKKPGGGYRNGAEAQEESLARASALATCLETVPEYYDFHRRQGDPLYSDRVICSPDVPVFRDEAGRLLPEPYPVTFLTAAAPNAGELRAQGWSGDLAGVLRSRAERVLAVAAAHRYRNLVLGAWGCGVFRNDPAEVAGTFADLLSGELGRSFDRITFGVFDPHPGTPTLRAFHDRLHGLLG